MSAYPTLCSTWLYQQGSLTHVQKCEIQIQPRLHQVQLVTGFDVCFSTCAGASTNSFKQQQQQIADSAAAAKRKMRQVPVVAGIVKATPWDPNADVSISIFPKCAAHAHVPGASCGQVCTACCDIKLNTVCMLTHRREGVHSCFQLRKQVQMAKAGCLHLCKWRSQCLQRRWSVYKYSQLKTRRCYLSCGNNYVLWQSTSI